jgi:hypothetical protein
VGFWSAICATVFSLFYVVAQLAEWAGWLGSAGGPESSSTVLGIVLLLTPSLLLGSSFLVLLVCIHEMAPNEKKLWTHIALAFGVVYTALISINYYVQLTLVAPRMARGDVQGIEPFLFVPFDSFLYAVDILGYSFMSVAAIFAALAFRPNALEGRVRLFLLATGAVLPCLLFQMYFHWLIWPATLWAVAFPAATWTLAIYFYRIAKGVPNKNSNEALLTQIPPLPRVTA